ncbi:MAG TPA: flagellar biosynthesis protein FlgG, partial [Aquifex aeolicus]|nr:flagellar biosynthesis protein FlgG [Aquifex aeolicus]
MALDYQPLYILASGMLLQERKLGVVTHNLSNVNTPSFKRDLLLSATWYTDGGVQIPDTSPSNPTNNFVYPLVEAVVTLVEQGPLRETGNPLDLALEGEG